MADYESDSSDKADVETGVTLGYATKEATGDDFSQLGGWPTWLEEGQTPPGAMAKCKVCNGSVNMLLQLHGDLPERFPGHERRLYLFGCRRKACRRKEGSIRGLRYTKVDKQIAGAKAQSQQKPTTVDVAAEPASNLGNTLFGVKGATTSAGSNPFATKSSAQVVNPFASSSPSTSTSTELSQTFADKARIAAEDSPKKPIQGPVEAWPTQSSFPESFPVYHIDADKEFLDPEPAAIPQQARVTELEDDAGGSSTADDKTAFESTMDKTFQKFADRLSQNPEQVLRYEYGGQPLLYSKKDAVGKTWPRIPRCSKCGGQRHFELQLTPHAITELEADDISLEGMEWGTVMLAVCGNDCEGWTEEWVGVQFEEAAGRKPT